jgi:hypothetical protein
VSALNAIAVLLGIAAVIYMGLVLVKPEWF